MRVAVLGFGSVWRHRPGRTEGRDRFAQPVLQHDRHNRERKCSPAPPDLRICPIRCCWRLRPQPPFQNDRVHIRVRRTDGLDGLEQAALPENSAKAPTSRLLPDGCKIAVDGPTRSRKRRLEISRHLASFLERVRWAAGGSVADVGRPVDPNQSREFRPRAFDNRISDAALGAAR